MSFLRSLVKYRNYNIFVYGAGIRGEYIIRWLNMEHVPISFIIDRDKKKEGTEISGCTIYSLDKLDDQPKDRKYLAIIATAKFETEKEEIISVLYAHGIFQYIYPFTTEYNMPEYRYEWAYYFLHNKKKIIQSYALFEDIESKKIFFEYIKTILTNCVYRGIQQKTEKKYFECYTPLKNEVFLNVGSYVGDTIFYFIENRKEEFEKIYGVEGNKKIYLRLIRNLNILPDRIKNKIECMCSYLDNKNADAFANRKITLINMDIEGAEGEVLVGLKNCIIENRPVLALCAYHRSDDLIELPNVINSMVDKYKFFLRKYAPPYGNHLENGELVLYAVPEERS